MQGKRKCIFLDRDGVLNEDRPDYAYQLDHFKILPKVPESLARLKEEGYLLVVITNQSGISQGIYTQQQMEECHRFFQEKCDNAIDHFYYSPYHPTVSASLGRKPGTLLFEKAIAKFSIDTQFSWMIGDRGRDLIPARQLGIRTIQIGDEIEAENRGDYTIANLDEALPIILSK
ncbi:MAG: HAD-IIIA family hydrolase [Cyclobacteriaceae bacterium]